MPTGNQCSLLLLTGLTLVSGVGVARDALPRKVERFTIEYDLKTSPDPPDLFASFQRKALAKAERDGRRAVSEGRTTQEIADQMTSAIKAWRPSSTHLTIVISSDSRSTLYMEKENGVVGDVVLFQSGKTYSYSPVGPRLMVTSPAWTVEVEYWPYLPFGMANVVGIEPRAGATPAEGSIQVRVPCMRASAGSASVTNMVTADGRLTPGSGGTSDRASRLDFGPEGLGTTVHYMAWLRPDQLVTRS